MRTFNLLAVLLFCCIHALGQGMITGISISPSFPTVNDPITVYVDVTFNSGDCQAVDQGIAVNGNDIMAYAHHCVGMLTVICNTTDTFELEPLAAGEYSFDFTLTSGFGGPSCSPGIVPDDNDQLQFTVSPNVGITENELNMKLVYPVPMDEVLYFHTPLHMYGTIVDISGKTVATLDPGSRSVSVAHLGSGVYVLRVGDARLKLIK